METEEMDVENLTDKKNKNTTNSKKRYAQKDSSVDKVSIILSKLQSIIHR